MSYVQIDIEALAKLVRQMTAASSSVPADARAIGSSLDGVLLSDADLRPLHGGSMAAWFGEKIRGLNRRLALARFISKSTPGFGNTVYVDESKVSDASPKRVSKDASDVAHLLQHCDDKSDVAKLRKLLNRNTLDPYFAKALASRVDPGALQQYMSTMDQWSALGPCPELGEIKTAYGDTLTGLGMTLGLASQGTGELAVRGMTQKYTDCLKRIKGTPSTWPQHLSMLLGRGQWSANFLVSTARTLRSMEDDNGGIWAVAPGVLTPDEQSDATDPFTGLFQALAANPEATRRLFAEGPTTEITSSKTGTCRPTNEFLSWVMTREQGSHLSVNAFATAISNALNTPPVDGSPAFQPGLAGDYRQMVGYLQDEEAAAKKKEAEEAKKPFLIRHGHDLLDAVGLIPIAGDVATAINGVWYWAVGDHKNASIEAASMIPVVGVGKFAIRGGKWVKEGGRLTAKEWDEGLRTGRVFFRKGATAHPAADLTKADSFRPARFMSPWQLRAFSGKREWLRNVVAGTYFNNYAKSRYAFNEVPMAKTGKLGGHLRLDSYVRGKAIIFRRLTQLADHPDAAMRSIKEFKKKYSGGSLIGNTKAMRDAELAGKRLKGQMVFQVPPQARGVPEDVQKFAGRKDIAIVDVNGKVLNSKFLSRPVRNDTLDALAGKA